VRRRRELDPNCSFHPDDPAIGICMRCKKAICKNCCTRVRDINHCHACLKGLAEVAEVVPLRTGSVSNVMLVLLVWLVLGFLFYWSQGLLLPWDSLEG
jgi:hypothetical protein